MAQRKPRERVNVTHPSGAFSVQVSPARAAVLAGRGYSLPGEAAAAAKSAPGGADRAALIARAKALGIPASGTNAALLANVEAGEKALAGDD